MCKGANGGETLVRLKSKVGQTWQTGRSRAGKAWHFTGNATSDDGLSGLSRCGWYESHLCPPVDLIQGH
jgi:hypothetical protein